MLDKYKETKKRYQSSLAGKKAVKKYQQSPKGKEAARRYWQSDKARITAKTTYLRNKYGLSLEDYDALFIKQGGKCAICGADSPGGRGGFHVDHNHTTGKVRGILCSRCNLTLGHLEKVDWRNKAQIYLGEPI